MVSSRPSTPTSCRQAGNQAYLQHGGDDPIELSSRASAGGGAWQLLVTPPPAPQARWPQAAGP
eukprot:3393469-Prorocentrum_lima.AAC.1